MPPAARRETSRSATALLLEWGGGAEHARAELMPLVYDELRRIARLYLRRERSNHTLQPTAVVHEAFLRLIDQRRVDWRNRAQFVGLAATMMRRVLINHARDRAAAKRGGSDRRVTLSLAVDESHQRQIDLVAVHEALERLNAIDARKARVVELKFFGGLTTSEVAEVVGTSVATVERDWTFARAWLYDALGDAPSSEP